MKTIRIGTRDSQLALWQAKIVQNQLEALGHKTVLVPLKSAGDLVLDKPLYQFLSQKDAIIATGSLRRRAQWLNRYPTHSIVDLRGNVNSRLQKLENNEDWNGAIFAAAGLGRLKIRPENSVNLDWMTPAPAQGAIMVTALKDDEEIRTICAEINHEETEICTTIEREFLNLLEGGCTAPIGALAFIKNEEVNFKGVLLSSDGSKKIEVTRSEKLGDHQNIAKFASDYIIEHGGKRLMDDIKLIGKKANIYSTKKLTEAQKFLFNKDLVVESNDAIKISLNRIPITLLKSPIKNVIITSKNAVEAILNNCPAEDLKFKNIYCVGRRTKCMIEDKIGQVKHSAKNAKALAEYLVEFVEGTEVTYFCSNLRLDDLPKILSENNITVNEVEAYQTKYDSIKIDSNIESVLFYSPSTVQGFLKKNKAGSIAFCIGETTAKEASKHFKEVYTAKIPTVESVIELVNKHYI
ncbi:MAG: uroporphyrinogen-III synthase [Flavobacteriaceae bacterium]